jgi:hypothetical protein
VFNWGELAFVGIFAAVCVGVIHLIFNLLINRARSTMGIAAGPKVAALIKQKGQAMALAGIVPAVVVFGLVHSGSSGKKIEWQPYASERGEYSADMPGSPVITQQTQSIPNGDSVVIYSAAVDLGGNGTFAVLDLDGPKLSYERGDQGELMNANNTMVVGLQATVEQTDFPYPVAWGEVPCAETRGHLNKDPQQLLILRSWRTGAHTYAALAAYRPGTDSEAAAHRFLESVRPTGGYQKPGPNHS